MPPPLHIPRNLRHLRLFMAVMDTGTITAAAARCLVTQPAVTQAIAKLETASGGALFERTRQGFFPTPRGTILAHRAKRAFAQLEQEAGRILFERTAFGMIASSRAKTLAQCTRLAMAELDQAEAELSALSGEEVGRLTIGSLPLSRSVLLPEVITAFREHRATYPVEVRDGPYDELLSGLRRGEIDLILGALRDPAPIGDVTQEPLFADNLAILAGNHHPLIGAPAVRKEDLHRCGWVVPRRGTPAREQFENFFADLGPPASLVEAGSILLMRELLDRSELLGCISSTQARAETTRGLLTELPVAARWAARPIGLTTRSTWEPTPAQAEFLAILKSAAARLAA